MTDFPPTIPRFSDALRSGFVVTVGADIPLASGLSGFLGEAASLRGRAAAVVLSGGRTGSGGVSPAALASLVREHAGLDVILPLRLREAETSRSSPELLAASAMGVENFISLDGLPRGTDLFVGVSVGAGDAGADGGAEGMRTLAAAGARFIMTGPVFRRREIEGILREAAEAGLPVIAGILPITSHGMLRTLEQKEAGRAIPAEVRDRLLRTPAAGVRAEAVLVCREALEELGSAVAGVHIMAGGDASVARAVLGDEGSGAEAGDGIEQAVLAASSGARIPCRAAFKVAADLGVPPEEVGRVIQQREVKIVSCQLGCFR